MKVLLLTPFYAVNDKSNLFEDTRAIHYFTKEWVKDGHDVMVVHTYFNPLSKLKGSFTNWLPYFMKTSNKRLSYIDGVKIKLYINNKYKLGLPKLAYLQKKTIKNDIQYILEDRENRPDIIIAHFPTLYLNLLNSLFISYRCPIVGVFHKLDIKKIKKNNNKNHYSIFINSLLNGIGFRSKSIQLDYHKLIQSNIKHEFMVKSGAPDEIVNSMIVPDVMIRKRVEILYVGKLIYRKNVDIILYALKKLDNKYNFRFTIIGEGKEKKKLTKLIKKLDFKNNVRFLYSMPRDDIFREMKKSDIFVMPSVNETLGLVYLEAMANGCITIGTRNEGIDGVIVDKHNGFLVEPNSNELTHKIEMILCMNSSDLKKIKFNAFNTIKKYSESNVASLYINEIKKVFKSE